MNYNNLQKLAIKMEGLFPQNHFDSPQECFNEFVKLYATQYDYLIYFSEYDLIILMFYIYSYKNTKGFKLSDDILSRLGFASLFITQGDYHITECETCHGNGGFTCIHCQGEGYHDCPTCFNGEISCPTCGGDGMLDVGDEEEEDCYDCDGTGDINCPDCGGNSHIRCEWCDGKGANNCSDCDGSGEVESDEYDFDYFVIVTWDKYIKDNCKLKEGTMEPALSEYEFDTLKDKYIVIGYDVNHQTFPNIIQANEAYCTFYDDEPKIYKNQTKTLQFWFDDDNLEHYLA